MQLVHPKPLCILFPDTKGIQWFDTDASDANCPRKAIPNKNSVSMFIRMEPCKIQVLFPLAPE